MWVLNDRRRRSRSMAEGGNYAFIAALLKSYGRRKKLCEGMALHADILRRGLLRKSPHLGSSLISMYAKCGKLERARSVLGDLPFPDVVSWNALIAGSIDQGRGEEALDSFRRMQAEGFSPDAVSYTCALKACGRARSFDEGREIHDEIVGKGLLEKDVKLGTALVDMYAKCGALAAAKEVLEELPVRNEVSWSALITGYAREGRGREALTCLEQMQSEGLCPDSITLSCVLKACGSAGAIGKGEQIHREILRRRLLDRDLVLGNALIDMYAKCGELGKARGVAEALPVRDAVSWCTLIAGYVQEGLGREALDCFEKMQSEGLTANAITLICVLRACGIEGSITTGARIHREMAGKGLLERDPELGNALVDMYVKCGDLGRAREVLRELPRRDIVSWSALIAGYAERGKIGDALRCLEHMQGEGLSPNAVTYACLLKACGSIGALDKGQEIHGSIVNMGLLEEDSLLGNALLDMYAKCGALAKARRVLEALPVRSTVSWNTLIAGYAQQGRCVGALKCLEEMQSDGFSPNEVTFLCVVNAFNHSGLLAEAQSHFADMSRNHGLAPELQHHTCIVAGLGRGAQFDKAVSVIKVMPASALSSPAVWVALLGGCREWGNVKLATLAFDQALQIDPCCAPAYVLMSSIFLAAGMHKDAAKLRSMVPKPGI